MYQFKKILLIALILWSISVKAQDYKEFIEMHRTGYKAAFINDPNAPLKAADMKHLHFFKPNEIYKVTAEVEILSNMKPFKMPTYDGTSKEFIRYATATALLKGQKITLTLYKNLELANNPLYKDYLFLPFTDLSNNKESYGGGRYMDFNTYQIEHGKLIIDFNKAYNPYCAYSSGYRCPVPPEENDLNVKILAGEKKYTGSMKTRF